jgi:hypothetical protein
MSERAILALIGVVASWGSVRQYAVLVFVDDVLMLVASSSAGGCRVDGGAVQGPAGVRREVLREGVRVGDRDTAFS